MNLHEDTGSIVHYFAFKQILEVKLSDEYIYFIRLSHVQFWQSHRKEL
jgi:hypothetical protein